MDRTGARPVGQWVEYECQGCRAVLQARPVAPEDELCEGCRGLTVAQREICALRKRVADLEIEVARLARENSAQCDEIADRDQKIADLQDMLMRAHCEAAPTEPPPSRAA